MNYVEILTDYTDDQNLTTLDAYGTGEEGKVIGVICRDTAKVILRDQIDNSNPLVREAIYDVLSDLKLSGEVYPKFRRRLYASLVEYNPQG